jgi:hypothetical protein
MGTQLKHWFANRTLRGNYERRVAQGAEVWNGVAANNHAAATLQIELRNPVR